MEELKEFLSELKQRLEQTLSEIPEGHSRRGYYTGQFDAVSVILLEIKNLEGGKLEADY